MKQNLKTLSKEEINKILDYYREIYGDKADTGMSEDMIVDLFGSPDECAKKLLMEEGRELPSPPVEKVAKEERKNTSVSPAQIVGMVFASLLLFIPLFVVFLGIIVSCGSIGISGVVSAVAGVLYAICSPLLFAFFGASVWGILANISVGVALTGAGLLLVALGYYATKYTVTFSIWLFKIIYFRGAR